LLIFFIETVGTWGAENCWHFGRKNSDPSKNLEILNLPVFCVRFGEMRKVIIFIFLLFSFLLLARLLVGGGEDTWICVDGQWVKHGAPAAPMPERECGKQSAP